MRDITIVTAFFDIGRSNFKDIPRSNEKYLEHFKFWARLKNNIVVYTDHVMAESVNKIREEYGLSNNTKIVIIDDISQIDNDLLTRMKKIEKDSSYLAFRYNDKVPENKALYDYVMLIKTWCINDAVNKGYVNDLAAWLDFGFNSGGKLYYDEKDFDFEWKYDFSEKITFFSLNDDDGASILKIINNLKVYIMGGYFIVPKNLAKKLWDIEKEAMNSLIDCGFIDDDQLIMLMITRKYPELFDIIKSDWYLPLKQCGGEHLKLRTIKNKIKLKDRLLKNYRINVRNRRFIKKFKKEFVD